jgi:hypothetical protein
MFIFPATKRLISVLVMLEIGGQQHSRRILQVILQFKIENNELAIWQKNTDSPSG